MCCLLSVGCALVHGKRSLAFFLCKRSGLVPDRTIGVFESVWIDGDQRIGGLPTDRLHRSPRTAPTAPDMHSADHLCFRPYRRAWRAAAPWRVQLLGRFAACRMSPWSPAWRIGIDRAMRHQECLGAAKKNARAKRSQNARKEPRRVS